MPFAQKRFCSSENITNMQTISDVHNKSFGENYGTLIEGLPLPLLSRAIFVVDKTGKLTYVEYVRKSPIIQIMTKPWLRSKRRRNP